MLTVGELGGLVAVVAVAMVGTASLALAETGHHDGWLAIALGLAATCLLAGVAWRSDRRPVVSTDKAEIALVAAAGVAAAFFFLPGFPYASADKDPGIYVSHAFAIAREGDTAIPDAVLEQELDPNIVNGARFPGIWLDPDDPEVVTPQFYHLYPATLATADDVVGSPGVFHLTPVLAALSVCLLVLAVRRAANTVTALVFGALLVTSMIQVWQAKYPSTEVLAQLLLAGSLLGGVLAIEARWAGGAFCAGLLLGVGFLARPDGFLYVLLAAAVVGVAVAARRFDRRSVMLGAGLALTFPYAAVNAYDRAATYTDSNDVPGAATLVAAVALIVLSGFVARGLVGVVDSRRGPADREAPAGGVLLGRLGRWQVPIGALASVITGLGLVVLWHRERLF
ncbi:MAG: hypothetical protein ACRDZN_13040, partial [Acidimicrobiales bacterium]